MFQITFLKSTAQTALCSLLPQYNNLRLVSKKGQQNHYKIIWCCQIRNEFMKAKLKLSLHIALELCTC